MNTILIGIAVLIAISLPVCWLIAELRDASKATRILLGLGIMSVLLGVPFVMNDVFVVRRHQYDRCITRIAELVDQGDQETVRRATAVWNKDRGDTSIGNVDHVNAVLENDPKVK
jgi:hypothetical protein